MRLRDLLPARLLARKPQGRTLEKAGLILLLLYVLAGVVYSAFLSPVARFPDEIEYLKLSGNLIQGAGYSMDGVHLTASRPPGYAFFLVPIRALGGDYFTMRALQFLLLGGTVFLTWRLCPHRPTFGGLFTVISLVVCYPVVFYTSGTLYPQTLSAFLFVLALNLLLTPPRGAALNIVAGVVFGALILVVPTFLLTLAVLMTVSLWLRILPWRAVLWIIVTAGLVVGSWTVRNAETFHRFVPVASNSGVNLLIGNNERATPYEAAANDGIEPYYKQTEKLNLDEFQTDHFFQQAALTWMKTHPRQALILYLKKVLNFFNVRNVYVPGVHAEITPWKEAVMAASYLFLLALLAWRLSDWKRFPLVPREKFLLAVYVLSAFTSAIFFTRIRHRLPFDYLIIAVIASYLSRRLEMRMGDGGQPADAADLLPGTGSAPAH